MTHLYLLAFSIMKLFALYDTPTFLELNHEKVCLTIDITIILTGIIIKVIETVIEPLMCNKAFAKVIIYLFTNINLNYDLQDGGMYTTFRAGINLSLLSISLMCLFSAFVINYKNNFNFQKLSHYFVVNKLKKKQNSIHPNEGLASPGYSGVPNSIIQNEIKQKTKRQQIFQNIKRNTFIDIESQEIPNNFTEEKDLNENSAKDCVKPATEDVTLIRRKVKLIFIITLMGTSLTCIGSIIYHSTKSNTKQMFINTFIFKLIESFPVLIVINSNILYDFTVRRIKRILS